MRKAIDRAKRNCGSTATIRQPTQDGQPVPFATCEYYEQGNSYESASLPGQEVHATQPCQPLGTEAQTLGTGSPATVPADVAFSRHPSPPPRVLRRQSILEPSQVCPGAEPKDVVTRRTDPCVRIPIPATLTSPRHAMLGGPMLTEVECHCQPVRPEEYDQRRKGKGEKG